RDRWRDVLDQEGRPVEYVRSEIVGDSVRIGPVPLPAEANNQPVVQLRWKYYFIPTGASGARAELRVDDIFVWPRSGRRPLLLASCGVGSDQRFWARYIGMAGETGELLASDDMGIWIPVRGLRADAIGNVEFDEPVMSGTRQRFYQLRRLIP
ncbi:MAG: hypothetical protein N3G20_05910, partial [Verrucomicrobiae bacterium]|nr:hypothetical protein [Verrucomicrobiae bacterium]